MEKLTAKASIQIQKPVNEVFSAIVSANKMNRYFIESSTGNLETDKNVQWKFPEFDDVFPVTGRVIKENEYVSFDWIGEPNMLVEIFLQPQADNSTVVKIVEHEMEKTYDGIKQMMQQTEGWANFLACLKASLEYNINLRNGAFDYMRTKNKTMGKITVQVAVNAPIEKVWDKMNNPKDIEQWNQASPDWHCINALNNLEVGGKLKSTMAAKDGSFPFDLEGIYDEIIPKKFIKYHLEDGRTVEISFEEKDNHVLVTETFDAEDQNPEEMQKEGWQAILNSFKNHAETN